MIEIVHPGWLSMIVDEGRRGYAEVGVPSSSALDGLAFKTLNLLLGNQPDTPAIEVVGTEFALSFTEELTVAITGARVLAHLDGETVPPWSAFTVRKGSLLRVGRVLEGFRYYVGFAGRIKIPRIINSFSTNLECAFGGFRGRPFMRGDRIRLKDKRKEDEKRIPAACIGSMDPPHVIRIVDGPEIDYFMSDAVEGFCSIEKNSWYSVSAKSSRSGIRLAGQPLRFKEEAPTSIVSEGILPGTIQVPGDGMPIIVLYERTIGGYARIGIVAEADRDQLAHLKPKDKVMFDRITIEEARRLNTTRDEIISSLFRPSSAPPGGGRPL